MKEFSNLIAHSHIQIKTDQKANDQETDEKIRVSGVIPASSNTFVDIFEFKL